RPRAPPPFLTRAALRNVALRPPLPSAAASWLRSEGPPSASTPSATRTAARSASADGLPLPIRIFICARKASDALAGAPLPRVVCAAVVRRRLAAACATSVGRQRCSAGVGAREARGGRCPPRQALHAASRHVVRRLCDRLSLLARARAPVPQPVARVRRRDLPAPLARVRTRAARGAGDPRP